MAFSSKRAGRFAAGWLFLIAALFATAETAWASAKRPFYVIAHRVNDIEWVKNALDRGANAIEIDIICRNGEFYVSHDDIEGFQNPLGEFMRKLGAVAKQHKQLALVILDIKGICEVKAIQRAPFAGKS